jgi:hypothetical protein
MTDKPISRDEANVIALAMGYAERTGTTICAWSNGKTFEYGPPDARHANDSRLLGTARPPLTMTGAVSWHPAEENNTEA